uniref:Putative ovule protein n=1 Tax=Solanum chacoense TaxID=4108 RepID=A0A0V0H0E8_SOLCH
MISSQCAASGFSMNKLRLLLLIQFHFFRQFRILMIPSYLMIRICFPYLKKGDLCHSHYASHMKLYSFQGLIIALFVTRLKLIITFL